jgi:hypothetical protein
MTNVVARPHQNNDTINTFSFYQTKHRNVDTFDWLDGAHRHKADSSAVFAIDSTREQDGEVKPITLFIDNQQSFPPLFTRFIIQLLLFYESFDCKSLIYKRLFRESALVFSTVVNALD